MICSSTNSCARCLIRMQCSYMVETCIRFLQWRKKVRIGDVNEWKCSNHKGARGRIALYFGHLLCNEQLSQRGECQRLDPFFIDVLMTSVTVTYVPYDPEWSLTSGARCWKHTAPLHYQIHCHSLRFKVHHCRWLDSSCSSRLSDDVKVCHLLQSEIVLPLSWVRKSEIKYIHRIN